MSKEYLQNEIDKLTQAIDTCQQQHPFIRSARSQIAFAQALLDRDFVRFDGTGEKALTFAFQAHLDSARRSAQMALAEPRLERDQTRQAGTKKERRGRWPELDSDIRSALEDDPKITARQIMEKLPGSFDGEPYYRDGDEIVSESGRVLQFGGFEKRVSKIRLEIRNAR